MRDRPIDKQLIILGRIELDNKEPHTSEIPDGSSCWHVGRTGIVHLPLVDHSSWVW